MPAWETSRTSAPKGTPCCPRHTLHPTLSALPCNQERPPTAYLRIKPKHMLFVGTGDHFSLVGPSRKGQLYGPLWLGTLYAQRAFGAKTTALGHRRAAVPDVRQHTLDSGPPGNKPHFMGTKRSAGTSSKKPAVAKVTTGRGGEGPDPGAKHSEPPG